jgi:hypothetical protein
MIRPIPWSHLAARFRPAGKSLCATVSCCLALVAARGAAQAPDQAMLPPPPVPPASDDYTRYELLAPDTASFRIVYEVTATRPGARAYFNPIRKGSVASDEAVYDRMTGTKLAFEVVSGAAARAAGEMDADLDTDYIKVSLPRPVPADGGVRLRIDKTYKDPKSYFRDGDLIVYSRSLGIRRNAVVLPAGYELVSCNYPSQVITAQDGRTTASFINIGPRDVPFVVKARKQPAAGRAAPAVQGQPAAVATRPPGALPPAAPQPSEASRLSERAHQDRDIVYFLQPPETHAFRLYHDYTESREGVNSYVNVVRQGSTVSNPSARILDTGEALAHETLRGDAVAKAKLDIGEPVRPDTEVVVVHFKPVAPGQSIRLRIEETYADPGRYFLRGDELVFDRELGRPSNAVVLPEGWFITASAVPAIVSETPDGRIRLDYVNPRSDDVSVLVKARRRQAGM